MKKVLSLLLCLLMAAPSVVSCQDGAADNSTENTPKETGDKETTETAEEAQTENEVVCGVPDTLTLQGETVSVLNYDYKKDPNFVNFLIATEEFTGETLNDAVHNAKRTHGGYGFHLRIY